MGIGGSIFLIALGAILAFAVKAHLGAVDIQVVGWVLMVAGFIALVLTMYLWSSRRRVVRTTTPVERQTIVEDPGPPIDRPY